MKKTLLLAISFLSLVPMAWGMNGAEDFTDAPHDGKGASKDRKWTFRRFDIARDMSYWDDKDRNKHIKNATHATDSAEIYLRLAEDGRFEASHPQINPAIPHGIIELVRQACGNLPETQLNVDDPNFAYVEHHGNIGIWVKHRITEKPRDLMARVKALRLDMEKELKGKNPALFKESEKDEKNGKDGKAPDPNSVPLAGAAAASASDMQPTALASASAAGFWLRGRRPLALSIGANLTLLIGVNNYSGGTTIESGTVDALNSLTSLRLASLTEFFEEMGGHVNITRKKHNRVTQIEATVGGEKPNA